VGDLCATRGLCLLEMVKYVTTHTLDTRTRGSAFAESQYCRPRKNPLKVEFQGDFLRAGFGGFHGHEQFEEHK
jgi:hypothetical protein